MDNLSTNFITKENNLITLFCYHYSKAQSSNVVKRCLLRELQVTFVSAVPRSPLTQFPNSSTFSFPDDWISSIVFRMIQCLHKIIDQRLRIVRRRRTFERRRWRLFLFQEFHEFIPLTNPQFISSSIPHSFHSLTIEYPSLHSGWFNVFKNRR